MNLNEQRKYKVYKYTFPNGMIYIGMTSQSIQHRRNCGYQHNARMKAVTKRYGWKAVKTEVLCDNLSLEEASKKEQEYIEQFNATEENVGYNISKGGKASYYGAKHTEGYKKRMSDLYKGKPFTKEHRENMAKAHAKEYKPVVMRTLNGELVACFNSLTEAASYVGGYKANISRVCQSQKPYKGYLWEFMKVR